MVYLLFTHTFISSFYHDPFATCVCVCWGCKVGSGDSQCGATLLLFCFIHFPPKQSVMNQLEEVQKRLTIVMVEARQQGAPDLSNWVWEERLNTSILKGKYIGDGAADETLSYLKGFLNVGDEEDRGFATVTLEGREGPQANIFCHKGLMGMGKTRLHNELCSPDSEVGKSVVKAMEEVRKPVRFIRITFNENFRFPRLLEGPINKETFWKQLLCFHGLNAEEAAKVKNEDDAVRHIRDKLDMQAGTTLVVCVDELMNMPYSGDGEPENVVGRLMGVLHSMQESSYAEAPIVFLFSAVTGEMLKAAEGASKRRTISAKLPSLSEEQLQELLFEKHPRLEQFKEAPMFELLFKLCAPTPRYDWRVCHKL